MKPNSHESGNDILSNKSFTKGVKYVSNGKYKYALACFEKIKHDPIAQFYIGDIYLKGLGLSAPRPEEGIHMLEESSRQGFAQASNLLGNCYATGLAGKVDLEAAAEWFEIAVEQKYVRAKAFLGQLYNKGYGKNASKENAMRLLNEAETQNRDVTLKSIAQYYIGENLTDEGKHREAFGWYEKSAENGLPLGKYMAFKCLFFEIGTEKDEPKAINYLKDAAAADLGIAQCALGQLYLIGRGVEKKPAVARDQFVKATESVVGRAEAFRFLGLYYVYESDDEQNFELAADAFEKAVELKDTPSKYYLGTCHYAEKGVKNTNPAAAIDLFTQAANEGFALAQYELGEFYNGKNDSTAKEWYLKAAENEHFSDDRAMFRLGEFQAAGRGGFEPDGRLAAEWYEKAAAKGNEQAKAILERINTSEILPQFEKTEEKRYTPADFGNRIGELVWTSIQTSVQDMFQIMLDNQKEKIINELREDIRVLQKTASRTEEKVDTVMDDTAEIKEVLKKIVGMLENLTAGINGLRDEFKDKFNKSDPDDPAVSEFIAKARRQIREELEKELKKENLFDRMDTAENNLRKRFGNIWDKLQEDTRTSLVSAWTLWEQYNILADSANNPAARRFDFSGVVICATGALENELKTIMFDGFKTHAAANINSQTDMAFKNKLSLFCNSADFTLGSVSFICSGAIKFKDANDKDIMFETYHSNERFLFNRLREDYLKKIMIKDAAVKYNVSDYTECFTRWIFDKNGNALGDTKTVPASGKLIYCAGSLNAIIEHIRDSFRNPAAHTGKLTHDDAKKCCGLIIGPDPAEATLVKINSVLKNLHALLK